MEPQPIALTAVLIVEDDAEARRRLTRLMGDIVGSDLDIETVPDLESARARLSAKTFSLALVDMQLPDGSGVDLIAWMQRYSPQVQAVVVSAWAEEESILAALRAGAVGYLLKECDDDELRIALKSLQRGGSPIDPTIARRILSLLPVPTESSPASVAPVGQLSEREREILGLVAQGFSNREIAGLVALSRLTIECHTKNIYRKLAVGSRTAAVFEARALGLLN